MMQISILCPVVMSDVSHTQASGHGLELSSCRIEHKPLLISVIHYRERTDITVSLYMCFR